MFRTAIVHEWLVNYAGSERVVESFTNIWPEADVFALVDFLNDEQREIILKGRKAKTSFIQKLPFAKNKAQKLPTALSISNRKVRSFRLRYYYLKFTCSCKRI